MKFIKDRAFIVRDLNRKSLFNIIECLKCFVQIIAKKNKLWYNF